MPSLVPLLIFTIFMASTGTQAFLLPPGSAHRTTHGAGASQKVVLSPAELEEQHVAETMEKGIQEYRNLMAAIRQLKDNTGLMGQLAELVGQENQEVFLMDEDVEDNRVCGKKLADMVARLCVGTCTEKRDIATMACSQGLTDSQLIAHCCPHSYRDAILPKHFVF